MGNLFTARVGNVLTALMGNVLTARVGKVLVIYRALGIRQEWEQERAGIAVSRRWMDGIWRAEGGRAEGRVGKGWDSSGSL